MLDRKTAGSVHGRSASVATRQPVAQRCDFSLLDAAHQVLRIETGGDRPSRAPRMRRRSRRRTASAVSRRRSPPRARRPRLMMPAGRALTSMTTGVPDRSSTIRSIVSAPWKPSASPIGGSSSATPRNRREPDRRGWAIRTRPGAHLVGSGPRERDDRGRRPPGRTRPARHEGLCHELPGGIATASATAPAASAALAHASHATAADAVDRLEHDGPSVRCAERDECGRVGNARRRGERHARASEQPVHGGLVEQRLDDLGASDGPGKMSRTHGSPTRCASPRTSVSVTGRTQQ